MKTVVALLCALATCGVARTSDGTYTYGTPGAAFWNVTVSHNGTVWHRSTTANTRLPEFANVVLDPKTLALRGYVRHLGGPFMWYDDSAVPDGAGLRAVQSRCCTMNDNVPQEAKLDTLTVRPLTDTAIVILPWAEMIPEIERNYPGKTVTALAYDPLRILGVRIQRSDVHGSGPVIPGDIHLRYATGAQITDLWYDPRTLMPDSIATDGQAALWNCKILPKHCNDGSLLNRFPE